MHSSICHINNCVSKTSEKHKKALHAFVYILIVALCVGVVLWYTVPFRLDLPDECVIKIVQSQDELMLDEYDSEMICEMLEKLKLKRELLPFDGYFSSRIQADDYMVIEVYDGANPEDIFSNHIGNFVFVKSNSAVSRFVYPSDNNRAKCQIEANDSYYAAVRALEQYQ